MKSMTLVDVPVSQLVADYHVELERELQTLLLKNKSQDLALDGIDGMLYDDVLRLFRAGGKRIRATLALLGYLAGGGQPSDKEIRHLGVAIELCHCAALIHDDIIDEADLRRGVSTSHVYWRDKHATATWNGKSQRFGESAALLAGLLASIVSDEIVCGMNYHVRDYWTSMKRNLVVGEFAEIQVSADGRSDPALLREIGRRKTSDYTVSGPLILGACLAGTPGLMQPFEQFGTAVGEAFQLRDDILDATETSDVTGKTTGMDSQQNKSAVLRSVLHNGVSNPSQTVTSSCIDSPLDSERIRAHLECLLRQAETAVNSPNVPEDIAKFLMSFAHTLAHRPF